VLPSDDFDTRVRREAMAWLTIRTNDGSESLSSLDILEFRIDGEPFRLMDPQRGIRKPKELAAALSVRTVFTRDGGTRPYDDAVGVDGLLRYKWRGDDPEHPENRALRAAWRDKLPLIWFVGVGQALYQPVYPVFLLWEETNQHQFAIDVNVANGLVSQGSPVEENLRRYIVRETKQRLHQPVFRATVLRAYETRCSVCSLRHPELLDAAHIVADSDDAGIASVRNGMAMCKIHHAAFDAGILGVRPDLVVEIRDDLLHEIDGPMLKHGLQDRHGQALMAVPRAHAERPDPLLLELTYTRFRAAG
jgi:putative restriction endonuclease